MKSEIKAFIKSFSYALSGIVQAIRTERNMRFHIFAALTAFILSHVCRLGDTEICIVFLCIGGVIASELINTAIEAAADMKGRKENRYAKTAKDCAAGAVLIMAAASLFCGVKIFFKTERLALAAGFIAAHPAAAVLWAAAAFLCVFKKSKNKSDLN